MSGQCAKRASSARVALAIRRAIRPFGALGALWRGACTKAAHEAGMRRKQASWGILAGLALAACSMNAADSAVANTFTGIIDAAERGPEWLAGAVGQNVFGKP